MAVLAAGVFLLTTALRMVKVGRSADLFVDELIYRYYNIDQTKLAQEIAAAGSQQPKP